jgi:hypothetical protein
MMIELDEISVGGKKTNSYYAKDLILTIAMRTWQAVAADSRYSFWEDYRSLNLTDYRSPYALWHNIPAWPKRMRKLAAPPDPPPSNFHPDSILIPVGATAVREIRNEKAAKYGWNDKPGTTLGHSAYFALPYYEIYRWYDQVVAKRVIK